MSEVCVGGCLRMLVMCFQSVSITTLNNELNTKKQQCTDMGGGAIRSNVSFLSYIKYIKKPYINLNNIKFT